MGQCLSVVNMGSLTPGSRGRAGLELETPHAIARNSIRSDLNRIVEEMTRHDSVQR